MDKQATAIELIKDLRSRTGLGLADCKRLLEQANGDLRAACLLSGVADMTGLLRDKAVHRAFPPCSVEGLRDPVPYAHWVSRGSVPRKCDTCRFLFEGECQRPGDSDVGMDLDNGPCPVVGSVHPVEIDTPSGQDVIPAKCVDCSHRRDDSIRRTVCTQGRDQWGDFTRSFDWGDWTPDA